MPSPISHILLTRNLPLGDNCRYINYKRSNNTYFQLGSIGPDIAYGAITDDDLLENENEVANLLHFTEKNQDESLSPDKFPLTFLKKAKNELDRDSGKRKFDALFWFFAGYSSHIIADGIFHPFVMDKVGRYEGENKAHHRALEIGIDILLMKHYTQKSGHEIEACYSGIDTLIYNIKNLKHKSTIFSEYSQILAEIYSEKHGPDEIEGWTIGLSRLFCLCSGSWPKWFRNLTITDAYVFRKIEDLEGKENDYLILEKPKYWDKNFLNQDNFHFIHDGIPQFNKKMKKYLDTVYSFIYEDGPEITERDLPAFSLDTGRPVEDPDNIEITPTLWVEA